MVNGYGACESYTTAYKLLLDEFDIENDVVVSRSMDHTWNVLKLNGKWCYVDVTWDDPVNGSENRNYFGMNLALLRRDHIFDSEGATKDRGYFGMNDALIRGDDSSDPVGYDCSSRDNFYYLKRERERCFSSEEELHGILDAFRSTKTQVGTLVYVGESDSFNLATAVKNWYNKSPIGYRITNLTAFQGIIMLNYDRQHSSMVNLKVVGHGSIDTASGIYPVGTTLTVKATPGKGYWFKGWYMGDLVEEGDTYSFTTDDDHVNLTVVALFEQGEAPIRPNPTPTNTPVPATPTPTPFIKLDQTAFTLYPSLSKAYSKAQLNASLSGATGTIKYESKKPNIATVSKKGLITAKNKGKTTITAYLMGNKKIKAQCKVTVKNPKIYKTSKVKVKAGGTETLKTYAKPKVSLNYQSLDESIATVSKKGVVKGVKKGETVIKVTVGKVSKEIKVTVY